MENDVNVWLEKKGINFFMEVGLKEGMNVLDFGCGEGHYTIPAAKLVGENGKIFAVDKDKNAIEKVKQIVGKYNLKNIEFINTEAYLPTGNEIMDFVMCYDMLHYLKKKEREEKTRGYFLFTQSITKMIILCGNFQI